MKILLSPAKTFSKNPIQESASCLFPKESSILVNRLKKLSLKDIEDGMRVSPQIAKSVYTYYENFDCETYQAWSLYDGQAFKALDATTIDSKHFDYVREHLLIMSGLYGLVRAFDGISKYRLEMQDKTIKDLYQFWKKPIHDFLADEWIINLASHEYSKILSPRLNILTIDFMQTLNGQTKSISMHTKKARGMMARYLITHQITHAINIKSFCEDGYSFSKDLSSDTHFVFKKVI